MEEFRTNVSDNDTNRLQAGACKEGQQLLPTWLLLVSSSVTVVPSIPLQMVQTTAQEKQS